MERITSGQYGHTSQTWDALRRVRPLADLGMAELEALLDSGTLAIEEDRQVCNEIERRVLGESDMERDIRG